jgi:hypothetical protein
MVLGQLSYPPGLKLVDFDPFTGLSPPRDAGGAQRGNFAGNQINSLNSRPIRPFQRPETHGHVRSTSKDDIFRSYHLENSDTHQDIELKHGWARLALG